MSCENKTDRNIIQKKLLKKDTVFIHDTVYINSERKEDWQKSFGLTHNPKQDSIWGKPVSYYIEDKDCNPLAFEFYYGYIRPSDNGTTTELLKLAYTDNNKLRPFYRWCLNKTLIVSDGALGELVGVPARKYAEKFPDEFFEYLNIENDNKKYEMWTEAIQYSGFFDYPDFDNIDKLINEHYKRMSKNLKNKSEKNLKRVRQFVKDCQAI
jgi:ribosomal protein S18